MVVLDGRIKSKALACLVFSNFLLVSVHGSLKIFTDGSPSEQSIAEIQVQNEVIQINKQVTVSLPEKEIKVFQYLDMENENHNLSVTIFPCGSLIKWSFIRKDLDEMTKESVIFLSKKDVYEATSIETIIIQEIKNGTYFLVFFPIGVDTIANIYITMDDGGPYELMIPQKPNILLTPQRRHRLKVTWEQSLLNPQNTSYCLVVNTEKEYPSLCAAEREGFVIRGSAVPVHMPILINLNNLKLNKNKKTRKSTKVQKGVNPNSNTKIVCVDRKVRLTFTKLRSGVKYYFNLFAINNKTNLTIPYGNSFIEYNFTSKPINLIDGVRKLVDLKKLEGKAFFRYKVNKFTKELNFYVLVCGGAVDVEFKSKGSSRKRKGRKIKKHHSERLPKATKVFGYKRFRIFYPAEGEQLYLKVNAPNVDELSRIQYVEVFMTMHPGRRYPLPYLPDDSTVYEFKSQKTCNSVTIGWIPTHDGFINTYCVVVWENRKSDLTDLFRGYFQCHLDEFSQQSRFFSLPNDAAVSKECEDMITVNKKSITNYKIRDLKPATSYTIQVTVKKKSGRMLSYKYLKAYTKHSCDY